MTIFEELYQAAFTKGIKEQTQHQSDEQYLKSILEAISSLDDQTWDSLSVEAANWHNEAVGSLNELKLIPPCPGFKSNDATPVKELKPVLVPEIKVAEKKKDVTVKEKTKRTTSGVIDAIRKTVVLNPEWNTRQVYLHMRGNGWPEVNINTIAVEGGNVRRTIDLAKSLGYWKQKDEEKETV